MNTANLIEWFEENFDCNMGPPRAFFQMPTGPYPAMERFYYTVYAIGTQNQDDPEDTLVELLHDEFDALLDEPIHKVLYWRNTFKIEFRQEDVQQYGKLLLTREEQLDGKPVPAGAVENWEASSWHEDAGKIPTSYLYTQLVIPALNWHPYTFRFTKPEGAIVRMV